MNTRYSARFAPGCGLREEDARSLLPFAPEDNTWQGVLARSLPAEIKAGTARAVVTCVQNGNLMITIHRQFMEPVKITYQGCFPEAELRPSNPDNDSREDSKAQNRRKFPGLSFSPKR